MGKFVSDEESLCRYVESWYSARVDDWNIIYYGIHRNKHTGIYLHEDGNKILDVLNDIHGTITDHFTSKKLIPTRFSSPHQLLIFLDNFRTYCREQHNWISKMPSQVLADGEVADILHMLEDVVEMATYCIESYRVSIVDDSYNKPYIRMKQCLEHFDIDSFMGDINTILNDIPYSIYKDVESEGRYHSIIHSIMFQLGFRVISEKANSLGRLDMLVELEKCVYIFEFKYSKTGEKLSFEAISQIKNKQYALSYLKSDRKVIAVGVTLGGSKKNAFDWNVEELN